MIGSNEYHFPQIQWLLRGLGAHESSENVKTTISRYRQFYDSHVVYKIMNSDLYL